MSGFFLNFGSTDSAPKSGAIAQKILVKAEGAGSPD
jgi:hypothetical protein